MFGSRSARKTINCCKFNTLGFDDVLLIFLLFNGGWVSVCCVYNNNKIFFKQEVGAKTNIQHSNSPFKKHNWRNL